MTRIKVQNPYSRVSPVRFHPGHYWNPKDGAQDNGTLDGNGNIAAASWQTLLNKIAPYSAIRGLTWRTDWIELETADGVYGGMAALKKRCQDLAAIGKYFIVHMRTRSFPDTQRMAPTWARNATYDGGDHAYGAGSTIDGYNINWYDTNVQTKMNALAAEIANQLSVYPNFEGVILMESAYGTRIVAGAESPLSGAQVNAHFAGLLGFISTVKSTRPDLLAVQYTNVRSENPTHIPNLVVAGCGIGDPDLWVQPQGDPWALNDVVWFQTSPQGLYLYYHDYLNQIPLVIHCQPNNYRWPTKLNFGNYVPTIQQLLDAAKTATIPNLQVNYLIWTDDSGGEFNATINSGNYPNFSNQVLAKLSEPAQIADPAGGLNINYPSIY